MNTNKTSYIKQKANILIVDDEPKNLIAVESILDSLDQNIIKVESGEEALKQSLDKEFAVILLDVQMPGMDGFETAKLIRQRQSMKDTPIIFLTAYDKTDAALNQGYALGAVDYIFKPIIPEILKSKVKVFVDLYNKTNQIRIQAEILLKEKEEKENALKILEQKKKELENSNIELSTKKAELTALLDSTDGAILTINEDGIIQSCNKRTIEIFGYNQNELLGKKIDVLLLDFKVNEIFEKVIK